MTRPIACDGGSGISNQRVQNLHNAMGQRAVKSVDGGAAGTIHFIYDQAGQVIAEIDAATGMTLREYIYVNSVQVALVDDTGTQDEAVYFVHTDHLATPQKITDSAQTVVWSRSYEPFGEVEETVNIVENNIRFLGQYADGETGLHYNYFRDYDPGLGRYVESDPIGLRGGVNTFGYAGGNPIVFFDENGQQAQLYFNYFDHYLQKEIGVSLRSFSANAMAMYECIRCEVECIMKAIVPGRAEVAQKALEVGAKSLAESAAKQGAVFIAKQISIPIRVAGIGIAATCFMSCE